MEQMDNIYVCLTDAYFRSRKILKKKLIKPNIYNIEKQWTGLCKGIPLA